MEGATASKESQETGAAHSGPWEACHKIKHDHVDCGTACIDAFVLYNSMYINIYIYIFITM